MAHKPERWDWSPELISPQAADSLKDAVALVPFWSGAGTPSNLMREAVPELAGSAAWISNEAGHAVSVDGSANYVDLNTRVSSTTEYSFLLYTKLKTLNTSNRLFAAGQLQPSGLGYDLGGPYFNSNLTATFFYKNGGNTGNTTTAWASGETVAFLCRCKIGETNGVQLWADGVNEKSVTGSGAAGTSYDFHIGRQWNNSNQVDQEPILFALWDRALTADECSRLTLDPFSLIRPYEDDSVARLFGALGAAGGGTPYYSGMSLMGVGV